MDNASPPPRRHACGCTSPAATCRGCAASTSIIAGPVTSQRLTDARCTCPSHVAKPGPLGGAARGQGSPGPIGEANRGSR